MVNPSTFRDLTDEYAGITIPKKQKKPADHRKLRILISIIDDYVVHEKPSTFYSLKHIPGTGTSDKELKKILPSMAKDKWIKRVEFGHDNKKQGFIPDSKGYDIINLLYKWQNGQGMGIGLYNLETFQGLPIIRKEFINK